MKMTKFLVALAITAFWALPGFAQIDPALLKQAEAGSADAQYNLGVMYAEGRGVPQDDKKAFDWYSKAADQGDVGAQYNLGQMYRTGRGVPRDDKKAVAWYIKAANQGFADAQSNLGAMYAQGMGAPQDIAMGCAWIYASGLANNKAYCDAELTPAQKSRARAMQDEITRKIASQGHGR